MIPLIIFLRLRGVIMELGIIRVHQRIISLRLRIIGVNLLRIVFCFRIDFVNLRSIKLSLIICVNIGVIILNLRTIFVHLRGIILPLISFFVNIGVI